MTAALLVVLLLQSLARGEVGEFTVSFMQSVFGLTQGRALLLYNRVIRQNVGFILTGAVAVFFIILSRFLLSQFAKYFNEISAGLDVLVGAKDSALELSPELATMERKLHTIKQTLEEREREAQVAEASKNDVVMYLAHDLKTPLTSVIGYLSLLEEAPEMPPAQKAKYVDITLKKAHSLEKLVDEFFEIARYNFQGAAPVKEQIDLYYMLAQMTEEFYPALTAKGKQVALNVPQDMTVYGDPDKLARVFNNILKNAAAYSPDNSVIEIKAAATDDTASIMFINAGVISPDKLAAIFEKFYRLDAARSSAAGGAGLGLAIAKEIVTQHGGRVWAKSDNQHTTFTVELPR